MAELKELISLYAAAEALYASVDSSQKPFYKHYIDIYKGKLKPVFDRDFAQNTEIVYQGQVQNVHLTGNTSKEQIISDLTSLLLEDYFNNKLPDYPKFTLLRVPLTSANRDQMMKAARQRIANPSLQNHDAEAILSGLGLLSDNQINTEGSIYAMSVRQKLEEKGQGQVLNRDELLHRFFKGWDNDWRSNDYGIDADLEFLVLAAMVATGEIEICYGGGKTINAINLNEIVNISKDETFLFTHIARPKGMDFAAVSTMFKGIVGRDLTPMLPNPEVFAELASHAKQMAKQAVVAANNVRGGLSLGRMELIPAEKGLSMANSLKALAGLCDRVQTFTTEAKLRKLPWTADQLKHTFEAISHITAFNKASEYVKIFEQKLNYLESAVQYMTDAQMKSDTEALINEFMCMTPEELEKFGVEKLKGKFDQAINRYADWYLAEYHRMHINEMTLREKNMVLRSNEYMICKAVCEADSNKGYISEAEHYTTWQRKISNLTTASPSVTKEALLRTPYLGFNPASFVGKQLPSVADMKEELGKIYDQIDEAVHQILKDNDLLKNVDRLEEADKRLLLRFNNNSESLTPENAGRLVEIMAELHKGIDHKVLKSDDFRRIFNRPMKPSEAIKAFKQYISALTTGSNDDDIRITFN